MHLTTATNNAIETRLYECSRVLDSEAPDYEKAMALHSIGRLGAFAPESAKALLAYYSKSPDGLIVELAKAAIKLNKLEDPA